MLEGTRCTGGIHTRGMRGLVSGLSQEEEVRNVIDYSHLWDLVHASLALSASPSLLIVFIVSSIRVDSKLIISNFGNSGTQSDRAIPAIVSIQQRNLKIASVLK